MTASAEELREMQETMLRSVLLRQEMPGTSMVLAMPDLQFVTAGGAILLLNENLHGPISIAGSEKPFRIVDRSSLSEAGAGTAYLRFGTPDIGPDTIRMTIEGRRQQESLSPEMGLSNVQVNFRKEGDRWVARSSAASAI